MPVASLTLGPMRPFGGRGRPQAGQVDGLTFAQSYMQVKPTPKGATKPMFGQGGLLTFWEDEAAIDAYETSHPYAQKFPGDYSVRLKPVRQYATHPRWGTIAPETMGDEGDGPWVVLTYATFKFSRMLPLLKFTAGANTALLQSDSLLAAGGLQHLPDEGVTITMWRDTKGMQDAVFGRHGNAGHKDAMAERRRKPFMKHDSFVRFKPLSSRGTWNGADPLAGLI